VVPVSTSISIIGLAGATAIYVGDGPLVHLQRVVPEGTFGQVASVGQGSWIDADKMLVLYVGQPLQQNSDVEFSFEVMNPTAGQESARVSLQTSLFFIGPQLMTQPSALLATVFSVDARQFVTAQISQTSCFPGATNTISAEFSINFDLTHRDIDLSKLVVSIVGLTSPSSTSTVQAASSASAIHVLTTWTGFEGVDLQFLPTGNWDESRGVMALHTGLGATGILSGLMYRVSWNIPNPYHAQDPPEQEAVSITLAYHADQVIQIQGALTMSNKPLSFMGSIVGDAFPLRVYGPSFLSLSVAQSSSWPSATNTVTITIVANIALRYPSFVTVSGLTGVAGPQTAGAVPVNPAHANLVTSTLDSPFDTTAAWNRETGILVLALKQCNDAGQMRTCYSLPAGIRQVFM